MRRTHITGAVTAFVTATAAITVALAHEEPPPPPGGGGEYIPETCTDHFRCGDVSPLLPMQSTEAAQAGFVWKKGQRTPKILFHARHSEHTGNDIADPEIVKQLIAGGALSNPANQFNQSLRSSYKQFYYGGYLLQQGLTQSVPTRIIFNMFMERTLLWDLAHPAAFANAGKFDTALLDESDFRLNLPAFKEVGYSAGLSYNIYCNGGAMLSDGRIVLVGGHNMNSNSGFRKVHVFDPETETWKPRVKPCNRTNWEADPFAANLLARDPTATHYPGCDLRVPASTDPADPSDMRYQRWYPSAVTLPDDTVLVIGGTDQDETIPPSPGTTPPDRDFRASQVHTVVPEVYDPVTDRVISLENARKVFPFFPQLEVVQVGPNPKDWVVCAIGGEDHADPTFDGPYKGKTWCLDVQAARRDPARETPAEKHWMLLATALEAHDYCCPTASLVTLGPSGETLSHKWALFSGKSLTTGRATSTIQMLDFTEATPTWRRQGDLIQTGIATRAVVLPDGKVFINGGTDNSKSAYEERFTLRFQMFDPATGTITPLAKTTVPRGLHGTSLLLPDARVMIMGENRENLVRRGDRVIPLGDPDWGVPNGQIYSPPYLFRPDGSPAERPVIEQAPEHLNYGTQFLVKVAGSNEDIASVSMVRMDWQTHQLQPGDRYVKLWFRRNGEPKNGQLVVDAPRLPGQAVQGVWMLFVINREGVPSVAAPVRLRTHPNAN